LAERICDLHRNGYKIIQNTDYFCFGCDAVLLTGFAEVRKNETLMDLGTGCGVIPLLLEAKTNGRRFDGLEIQEEIAGMARRSVALNNLTEKIGIFTGDIKKVKEDFAASSYDVVTSNPPYMNDKGGVKNAAPQMALARHEISVDLEGVVSAAAWLLRHGGRFYMVHKSHRLVDIITLLRQYRLEPKVLRQIQSFAEKPPEMVMTAAVKGAKPMLKVKQPLIIYSKQGVYTQEVNDIYYK